MSKQARKKISSTAAKHKKDSKNNHTKDVINPIIIPEIIHNKFLNESSQVVNEIIEKIISLVISTSFNDKVEKLITSSCYNFVRDTIDSYISETFISHDKDETNQESFSHAKDELIPSIEPISKNNEYPNIDINSNINNNNSNSNIFFQSNIKLEEQIYYNNYYHGENDWDLIDEPESNNYDRYAGTMIKVKELQKNLDFKYKKDGEVLEEIDEESEKNSININTHSKLNKNEKNKKRSSIFNINTNNISNTNNITNTTNITKKKIVINYPKPNKKKNFQDIMNQFSFHDLDNNDDIYIEPKEINYEELRKEVEEKQNIEKEEKKVNKKAKNEVEKKIKVEAEKNKHLIGKKITVDANGQIVFVKRINLDKLRKEFVSLKTGTKLVKDEEKEKEKSKKKKKKKENQEENAQTEDDKNKSNIKIEINEEQSDKNKTRNKNPENIKAKGGKFLPKIKNKFRTSVKDILEESYKPRLLKKLEEGPIMPSGSNFDIINLEVGVSLKENQKYKTGGKDFYHKYNKYSISNYNQQLKETTEVNSFLKTYAEVESQMVKSDINYLANLTDTYNSSIGYINNNSNINQQIQNSNKNRILTNFNTVSNFENKSLIKTKGMNSSLSPRLKLKGMGTSLMGSLERLSLITERQERLAKKTENIFRRNLSNFTNEKKYVLPKLDEIDKFTSSILKSKNWMEKNGVNNSYGSPFRNPEKPGIKEISREMGVRGKILRSRMKSNASQEQMIFPALEAFDFFKK